MMMIMSLLYEKAAMQLLWQAYSDIMGVYYNHYVNVLLQFPIFNDHSTATIKMLCDEE